MKFLWYVVWCICGSIMLHVPKIVKEGFMSLLRSSYLYIHYVFYLVIFSSLDGGVWEVPLDPQFLVTSWSLCLYVTSDLCWSKTSTFFMLSQCTHACTNVQARTHTQALMGTTKLLMSLEGYKMGSRCMETRCFDTSSLTHFHIAAEDMKHAQ